MRPFFRDRMKALGFKEHEDGFNFENIPSTTLDNSFHIESGEIGGGPASQRVHTFTYLINLRFFRRGFRKPGEAIDKSDATIQTILSDILSPANRLGSDIKDIVPGSISREPLSATNDNAIIILIPLSVVLKCVFN